jgi:hypothetical protein
VTDRTPEEKMNTTSMLWNQMRAGLPWARARFETSRIARMLQRLIGALTPEPMPLPVPVPVRRPRLSLHLVTLAALGVAAAAGSAHAYPSRIYDDTANGQLVDVQMSVEGQNTPLYASPKGDSRMYFEAHEGRNYGVVLRNRTGERIGVVLTVDGLNVIDGRRSQLTNSEPMYVLDPWESATIQGWRTSQRDIRKFVFVDEERSYAERTNQGNGDLGWIRVNAFREVRPFAWWGLRKDQPNGGDRNLRDEHSAPEAAPAPPTGSMDFQGREQAAPNEMRAQRKSEDSNPGTGWGEKGYDPVRETEFRAMSQPGDRIVLRYEYANGLRALGIEPIRWRSRTRDRDRGSYGYAQPPRW